MSEELTPMNHRELWLKAIATGTVPEYLEPMTHEELWLKAIAQGGGSGGGGVLVVNLAYDEDTGKTVFDKTWKEVYDADSVFITDKNESGKSAYSFISMGNKFPSGKFVRVLNPEAPGNTIEFLADSENGYPAHGS